jgi:hypothetical protein
MTRVCSDLKALYPLDDFEVIPKAMKVTDDSSAPPEWRMRCKDWCVPVLLFELR